jgi:hypothetical protein
MRPLPRFLHALTAVHAVGAGACFIMAIGSAASDNFRASLAVSGGSPIMVASFSPVDLGISWLRWGGARHTRILVLACASVGLANDAGGLWRRSPREPVAGQRRDPARVGGGQRECSRLHLREHTKCAARLHWALICHVAALLDMSVTGDAAAFCKGGSRSISPPSSAEPLSWDVQPAIDVAAPASRKSSIFLRRIVGSMFMRVNSKCAHH